MDSVRCRVFPQSSPNRKQHFHDESGKGNPNFSNISCRLTRSTDRSDPQLVADDGKNAHYSREFGGLAASVSRAATATLGLKSVPFFTISNHQASPITLGSLAISGKAGGEARSCRFSTLPRRRNRSRIFSAGRRDRLPPDVGLRRPLKTGDRSIDVRPGCHPTRAQAVVGDRSVARRRLRSARVIRSFRRCFIARTPDLRSTARRGVRIGRGIEAFDFILACARRDGRERRRTRRPQAAPAR